MAILARCPECKGTGRILQKLPFRANPKAWATSIARLGMVTCSRCNGSGRIGVE